MNRREFGITVGAGVFGVSLSTSPVASASGRPGFDYLKWVVGESERLESFLEWCMEIHGEYSDWARTNIINHFDSIYGQMFGRYSVILGPKSMSVYHGTDRGGFSGTQLYTMMDGASGGVMVDCYHLTLAHSVGVPLHECEVGSIRATDVGIGNAYYPDPNECRLMKHGDLVVKNDAYVRRAGVGDVPFGKYLGPCWDGKRVVVERFRNPVKRHYKSGASI